MRCTCCDHIISLSLFTFNLLQHFCFLAMNLLKSLNIFQRQPSLRQALGVRLPAQLLHLPCDFAKRVNLSQHRGTGECLTTSSLGKGRGAGGRETRPGLSTCQFLWRKNSHRGGLRTARAEQWPQRQAHGTG